MMPTSEDGKKLAQLFIAELEKAKQEIIQELKKEEKPTRKKG